ncbi:MAG: hypothetical protein A2X12_07570 [Bacteroidetes bacterium GWE2_29_8]|nr:MAG: hypothetical protein A2X12_07570 [Bacteroidetes bacterium GWE2_29_8]OFY22060.1 MAG: hypothetical protein A2X02_04435 [Bacteroidetes bacterium GWF2_29_10]
MKRFLIFTTIFSLIVIFIIPYAIGPLKYNLNGKEIILSILKSKKKKKKTKVLIIGDSVAQQLFNNQDYNDSIYSLCSNQTISFAGYYVLLKNFLQNNKPEEVVFLVSPFILSNNLDQIYTFQYFLKPFLKKEYYNEFSPIVWEQIKKQKLYYLSQIPIIEKSNITPKNEKTKEASGIISPINNEYMNKCIQLLKTKQISYSFVSVPVSETSKKSIEKMKAHKSNYNFKKTGMSQNEIDNFLNNIVFFPDTCFIDGTHFKNPNLYTRFVKF